MLFSSCRLTKENWRHVLLILPFSVFLMLVFLSVHLPFEIWMRCFRCIMTARTKFTVWIQKAYKFIYTNRSKHSPMAVREVITLILLAYSWFILTLWREEIFQLFLIVSFLNFWNTSFVFFNNHSCGCTCFYLYTVFFQLKLLSFSPSLVRRNNECSGMNSRKATVWHLGRNWA